jgi:hypothetical protein
MMQRERTVGCVWILHAGQLTHINLAADLTTTDKGCNSPATTSAHDDTSTKPAPPHAIASNVAVVTGDGSGKARSCAECKFYNHCGTTIIALDV